MKPATSTYLAFFRLHLVAFLIANLICIVFLFNSPYVWLVLIIKLLGYPGIYLLVRPWTTRYDYYFKNLGIAPVRLFKFVCIADFCLFSILIAPLSLLF